MQLAPLAWTQYHQFVELSVDAFHASETLVSELAVRWRFVGVVGASLSPGAGGRLAAAEAVRTSASTSADPASAAVRMDIAPPGGADSSRANTHRRGRSDCRARRRACSAARQWSAAVLLVGRLARG